MENLPIYIMPGVAVTEVCTDWDYIRKSRCYI